MKYDLYTYGMKILSEVIYDLGEIADDVMRINEDYSLQIYEQQDRIDEAYKMILIEIEERENKRRDVR